MLFAASSAAFGQLVTPAPEKEATVWAPSAPGSLIYVQKPATEVKPEKEYVPYPTHIVSTEAYVIIPKGGSARMAVGTDSNLGTHMANDQVFTDIVVTDGAIQNDGFVQLVVTTGEETLVLDPGQWLIVSPHMATTESGMVYLEGLPQNGQNQLGLATTAPPRLGTPYVRGCICSCGSQVVFLPGGAVNQRCGMDGDACVNADGTRDHLSGCTYGWGPGTPQS